MRKPLTAEDMMNAYPAPGSYPHDRWAPRPLGDEFTHVGALFSDTRKYRYALWRVWDKDAMGIVSFIALNPSTADETANDPTVRRCINFAKRWGFGGMYMLNAFAYRATNPDDMKAEEQPIGRENNEFISEWTSRADMSVICWGNHGAHRNRSNFVRSIIRYPFCLGCNKTGEPKHPLYLSADTPPRPYSLQLGGVITEGIEQHLKESWNNKNIDNL